MKNFKYFASVRNKRYSKSVFDIENIKIGIMGDLAANQPMAIE